MKNPGIVDFRDPKVMWYEPQKKWVMTLATKDRITFYSSPDLKTWTKESEFGKEAGAHGGVWECPDLFTLDHNGKKHWILIVNINPGGPNKGSATQYFMGDFDGKTFTASHTDTRWLDYGPDNYAGITWSNTGNRKIFLGWMSNWMYAERVPTASWRNAMTIPRELKIMQGENGLHVASTPVAELSKIQSKPIKLQNNQPVKLPCRVDIKTNEANDLSMKLFNAAGEEVMIGYDKQRNEFYIDRSKSGKTDFNKEFAARHVAPRLTNHSKMNIVLVIDVASIELFADDGLTVMTSIFFPNETYNQLSIQAGANIIKTCEYREMKSIWK